MTNNVCERDLRPAVIQRKVTNGDRAMWAAQGEADVRTVVATAALRIKATLFATIRHHCKKVTSAYAKEEQSGNSALDSVPYAARSEVLLRSGRSSPGAGWASASQAGIAPDGWTPRTLSREVFLLCR